MESDVLIEKTQNVLRQALQKRNLINNTLKGLVIVTRKTAFSSILRRINMNTQRNRKRYYSLIA